MEKKPKLVHTRPSLVESEASIEDIQNVIRDMPMLSLMLERVKAEMGVDDASHDLQHLFRVAMWTVRLNPCGRIHDNISAALLHDVVNVPKNHPLSYKASELSAAKAREILVSLSYEEECIDDICLAVLQHSFSRGEVPTTNLGKALQDADRLDAVGILGVFRSISCGAKMGASFYHPTDPWWKERELDDKAYTVDHFPKKLFCIESLMNTEGGRIEAKIRTNRMARVLHELGEEIGHPFTWEETE